MTSTAMPGTCARASTVAIPHYNETPITFLALPESVEPAGSTVAELMREEVEALCSHMLWLRNWWQAHEQGIRAVDSRAAGSVHDHFVDGAIFARSIARAAGFDMNEQRMRDYRWGRDTQTMRLVVGGAA